jgi:hypothetical protein
MTAPSSPPDADPWHCAPAARSLLAGLASEDVRIMRDSGGPGPCRLTWYPASDHGAAVFEALAALRQRALGPAFAGATDMAARAAALDAAQAALTVPGAIAVRFGDPDRWQGFGPLEATRRFRAWFKR